MKSLFLTTILAFSFFTGAFANNTAGVSDAVLNNFNTEFKKASAITWFAKKDYVKVCFLMNDQKMEAFYKANGDWIGTSRQIQLDELPVSAKRTFAKRYQDYNVKEAIYFESADENTYYISANNEKQSVILKVDQSAQLSLYKKTKS